MLSPRRPALGALLASLLLAMPAAAAPQDLARVHAAQAQATDGDAAGPLVGLRWLADAETAPLEWAVEAARLDVRAESQIAWGRVAGNLGERDNQDPRTDTYDHALARSGAAAGDQEVYLFPLPGSPAPRATVQGGCLDLAASATGGYGLVPHVTTPAPKPRADPTGATRLAPCAPATLAVEGDFLLVLWSQEAVVTADGREAVHWSGARPEPEPRSVPPLVQSERLQQLFIEARGARIGLPWAPGGLADLFLGGLELEAAALSLRDASGELGDGDGYRAQAARDLRFLDGVQATAGADGGRLRVLVRGDARVEADGVPLTWAAPVQATGGLATGLLLLLACGALAAPAGAVGAYGGWSRRRLEHLEILLALGDLEAVASRARLLAWLSPFRAEAVVLRVEALARLGRTEEALAALRRLPRACRGGPLDDFLHGHVLAAAGRPADSALRLARAARHGAEFRARILHDPLFDAARREGFLQAALHGTDGVDTA